jgi:hypothetical protein
MSIPSSLRMVNASQVSSVVVNRNNTTIYPTGGQSYSSGASGLNVIEFKIPVASNQTVDMSTFFMHFNFQITKIDTTPANAQQAFCFVEDSIESIIDEVMVYVGNTGQELERIRGYNRLESALNYYISDGFVNAFGGSAMGMGLSVSERKALYNTWGNANGNTVQFSVPLRMCGSASPSFIMPSQIFGQSNFLIIRVRLAPPAQCLLSYQVTDITNAGGAIGGGLRTALTGGATYTLSNVRATFDFVQTSQEYQNQISQFLASSTLVYPCKTWDVDFRNIPANQTTFVENLSYNYRDIEAIFFWFNKQEELGSFLKCGEDRLHVPETNANAPVIQSLQLTINGQKAPSVPIDLTGGASEAFAHLLSALGVLHTSEHTGPFNFAKLNTIYTASSPANADTQLIYAEETSNRFYGRNKLLSASQGQTNTARHDNTANVRCFGPANLVFTDTDENNPYKSDMTPSYFLIGLNMRKLLDLPEGELSGLNLQNTSGSISYELKFSQSSTFAYSMGVAVLHNRFISLSGAGVSVDI